MTVQLEVLPTAARPLKNRARLRLHVGTTEVMATVALLTAKELSPGTNGLAQLFLAEPVVTSWNQAFVIRSESPVETIGGGHVLVPAADKIRRAGDAALASLEDLCHGNALQRAAAAVYFAGTEPWTMSDLARLAGVDDPTTICQQLVQEGVLIKLVISAQRSLLWHHQVLNDMVERIEATLDKMHQREPLRSTVDRSRLTSQLRYCLDAPTLDNLLLRMQKDDRVRLTEKSVGLAGRGPKLSQAETKLLAEIIRKFQQAGYQPPTVKECEAAANKNKSSVASLISLAATEGDLVQISADYFLHHDVEDQLRSRLREALDNGGLTLSQIRELLATTRKYAVPICEYLDRIGFTRRDGDLRLLASPQAQ